MAWAPIEHSSLCCPNCGKKAIQKTATEIYRTGRYKGMFWACPDYPRCDAYVGCHPGTETALGTLAGRPLRLARKRVHSIFGPLWREKIHRDHISQGEARTAGYFWLAQQLGIQIHECHIGQFSIEQCDKALAALAPYERKREPAAQGSLAL